MSAAINNGQGRKAGPWKVCRWNEGKSFTVWREVQPEGEMMRIERMLNAAGNRKRFRSTKTALAAIAAATGGAA